jgi:flagellar motor protein MotB
VTSGIPQGSILTAGLGAKDPVVPDSDAKNRWKNRRVEIFLEH